MAKVIFESQSLPGIEIPALPTIPGRDRAGSYYFPANEPIEVTEETCAYLERMYSGFSNNTKSRLGFQVIQTNPKPISAKPKQAQPPPPADDLIIEEVKKLNGKTVDQGKEMIQANLDNPDFREKEKQAYLNAIAISERLQKSLREFAQEKLDSTDGNL